MTETWDMNQYRAQVAPPLYRTSRARHWKPALFVRSVRAEGARLVLTCDPWATPPGVRGGVCAHEWSWDGRAWRTARISNLPGLEIWLAEIQEASVSTTPR